ncbi:hypothetical protein [Specibacter sp. NPDC078709]|uniref:hypothetical protein n=1 Tax=Specibacter sp. NPDC078709 TaxID=3154364 RepID=UPI003414F34A
MGLLRTVHELPRHGLQKFGRDEPAHQKASVLLDEDHGDAPGSRPGRPGERVCQNAGERQHDVGEHWAVFGDKRPHGGVGTVQYLAKDGAV